jgi:hypothetical protein
MWSTSQKEDSLYTPYGISYGQLEHGVKNGLETIHCCIALRGKQNREDMLGISQLCTLGTFKHLAYILYFGRIGCLSCRFFPPQNLGQSYWGPGI